MNQPLVPIAYDIAWTIATFVSVVVLAIALTVWSRARRDGGGSVVDVLVIVLVPIIGPVAYLIDRSQLGRRRAKGTAHT